MHYPITRINLSNPCSEDWNNMLPAEQGRFCVNCQKNVIDFSQLTDEDIITYLSKHNHVCGRFAGGQMERINTQIADNSPSLGLFKWATLLAGLLSITMPAKASVKPNKVQTQQQPVTNAGKLVLDSVRLITGKVVTADSIAIPDVLITFNDSISVHSDIDGNFSIKLPSSSYNDLYFEKDYFSFRWITLQPNINNYTVVLSATDKKLSLTCVVAGGVTVKRAPIYKRVFNSVKRFFGSLF